MTIKSQFRHMNKGFKFFLLLLVSIFISSNAFSQEDDDPWMQVLTDTIINENPVYMPVIGIGPGYFNFFGEMQNPGWSPLNGNYGGKLNISVFVDKRHSMRFNFGVMYGSLNGNSDSKYVPSNMNHNFKTTLVVGGVGMEYNFAHMYRQKPKVSPFIGLGLEVYNYSPKADMFYNKNGSNLPYYYWNDGTVRLVSQAEGNPLTSEIVTPDGDYETDLSILDLFKTGSYSQVAIGLSADAGVDFPLTDRASIRFGSSLHYAFSDNIDNITDKVHDNYPEVAIKSGNDYYVFTYTTFNLDLFSSDESKIVQNVYAEADFDEELYEDEDNDNVLDLSDMCLGTPFGVEVDSLGCPYDKDNDGVPDYKDLQNDTKYGYPVDADGKSLIDVLHPSLLPVEAVEREYAYMIPVSKSWSTFDSKNNKIVIPKKFKSVDTDGDGFISYDEVLKIIDLFFDFKTDFKVEDIYELNELFFAQ